MAMKNTTETCLGKTIHGDKLKCKFLNVRLFLHTNSAFYNTLSLYKL